MTQYAELQVVPPMGQGDKSWMIQTSTNCVHTIKIARRFTQTDYHRIIKGVRNYMFQLTKSGQIATKGGGTPKGGGTRARAYGQIIQKQNTNKIVMISIPLWEGNNGIHWSYGRTGCRHRALVRECIRKYMRKTCVNVDVSLCVSICVSPIFENSRKIPGIRGLKVDPTGGGWVHSRKFEWYSRDTLVRPP